VLTVLAMITALAVAQGSAATPVSEKAVVHADSGTRVRISMIQSLHRTYIGNLVSADADSLRFTPDSGGTVAVPNASVARFERSLGRHARTGHGAAVGGALGAGVGLILGIAASSEDDDFVEVTPEDVVLVTLLLGATGAGVGALIGSASHGERWEQLALPSLAASVSVNSSDKIGHAMPSLR
jgi:hypothetical protein